MTKKLIIEYFGFGGEGSTVKEAKLEARSQLSMSVTGCPNSSNGAVKLHSSIAL